MVSLSYLLFAHLPWQTKEFDQGATRAALSPENALVSPEQMKVSMLRVKQLLL